MSAKKNKEIRSRGVWETLDNPETPEKVKQEKAPGKEEIKSSRNIDLRKDCRKPKRFSASGEEFTVKRGFVLTKETSRQLNLLKGQRDNTTLNEILDEALRDYLKRHLK